jgi:hypothetical protein
VGLWVCLWHAPAAHCSTPPPGPSLPARRASDGELRVQTACCGVWAAHASPPRTQVMVLGMVQVPFFGAP